MDPLTAYSVRAERVAFTLVAILIVLVTVHVLAMQANFNPALGLKVKYGFHYWQLAFFDLDEEESFGTWFNSGLLMLSAVLLLHRARVLRAQGESWHICRFYGITVGEPVCCFSCRGPCMLVAQRA